MPRPKTKSKVIADEFPTAPEWTGLGIEFNRLRERSIQLEREHKEAIKQNARIPRSGIALAELLAKHGVIQAAAIDDAEDYDGCDTIDRIRAAWEEMI